MPAAATSTGIYVYGVVHADELPAVSAEGVAATPVELIERDDLAAIASRLPATFRVKRRDLQRHLQVLEDAFAETTVVPCAFGTVLHSEEDVESTLLGERADELRALLKQLQGKVQLNVKALYEEDTLLREVLAANPEVARLREATERLGDAGYYQRLRLGEIVASLVDERRSADADRILAQLSNVVDDVVVDEAAQYVALKASFLVDRKRGGDFDARLEQIAREGQPVLRIEVIGPLPPTAFAGPAAER